MRKSRFTESQIVGIPKEGEAGVPIAELMRKHGISRATYCNWRSKYAGASVSERKRLEELETENAKPKRMYAELALENAAIKDLLSRKLQCLAHLDPRRRFDLASELFSRRVTCSRSSGSAARSCPA